MEASRDSKGIIRFHRIPGEKLCLEEQNVAIALLWQESLDLELLGEKGCAGNYDMYQFLYCSYNDKKYMLLLGRDQQLFDEYRTITLYPIDMNEEDYEDLGR